MRFYLSNSAASLTPSTEPGSIWEAVSGTAVTRGLTLVPTGTNTTVQGSEAINSSAHDVRLARFVSPPIVKAGAVGGRASWCFARSISATAGAFVDYVSIWVVSGDGSTNRGVVDSVADAAWPATSTSRQSAITTLASSVNAQAGDRVVVDIGFRSTSTNTTNYTGTLRYGGTSTTDLTNGDTANVTTRPSWIRFYDIDDLLLNAPTRMYFTSTSSGVEGDPSAGGWDDDSAADSPFQFRSSPAGDPLEVTRTETSATASYDVMLGSWVTPPLAATAIVPTSSVVAYGVARRSSVGANLGIHYRLYAITSTGSVRGQAFNWTNPPPALPAPPIFNESDTPIGLRGSDTTGTLLVAQPGDRFVFELGFNQAAATSTPATCSIWAGGTGSPDIAADDTDLNRPGWLDFPNGPVFEVESVEGTLDATLPAPSANLSGTVRANGALGGTLPVATAALTGTTRTTGTLAGALPLPTSGLDADTFVAGTVVATLPLPTAALTGTTATTGVLGAQLPLPAATLTGGVSVTGALAGQLPVPAADLDGLVTAVGALDATLPLPTAAIDGTTNTGTLSGTLPELFASLSGALRATGTLDATLPLPTAALGGDGSARGELEATLPMPTAALDAETANPGDLDTTLPIPTAGLAGTVSMTGALDAQLPLVTAALGGDGSNAGFLSASLPMPTAGLSAGITVVAVIHGVLPTVTASVTAGVTATVTLEAALPMPTAALEGSTEEQASHLDALLPMPVAVLAGTASTTAALAGVLPLPTASLSTRSPVVYEPPLRAGQPEWGVERLRAGTPELTGGLVAGNPG